MDRTLEAGCLRQQVYLFLSHFSCCLFFALKAINKVKQNATDLKLLFFTETLVLANTLANF